MKAFFKPCSFVLITTPSLRISPVRAATEAQQVAQETAIKKQKMGKIYEVIVDGLCGKKLTIDLCNTEEQMRNMTVLQLKEKIVKRVPSIEKEALRLIFADKHLDNDNAVLSDYGIQHLSIIRATLRVPGGLFA